MKSIRIFLATCSYLISACAHTETVPGPDRTLWDGLFSAAQAGRGAEIYSAHCETCHAANMRGGPGSRSIVGIEFRFLWQDKTLGDLFEAVRTKMPQDNPGLLSDQQYIDVITAILEGNGFPAGTVEELPANVEVLEDILITWDKPGTDY